MVKLLVAKTCFIAILILVYPCSYAQTELIGKAEVREIRWGGIGYGWRKISLFRNVKIEEGPMGRLSIVLDDSSPIPDENTDLYLHFDDSSKGYVSVTTPGYTPILVDIFPSMEIKKYGRASAGFLRYSNRIDIKPDEESLFFSERFLQSFTIDFFLYPVAIHDGDRVLNWYAPTVDSGDRFSGFKASFEDGRLKWEFENVFYKPGGEPVSVVGVEKDKTPLNEWHHHAIQYDSSTGMLVLFSDGKESDIRWLTVDGKEGHTLLRGKISPFLASPMRIGGKFLGYIDEFRISRGLAAFYLSGYRNEGVVISEVIDLENAGTKFVKIAWEGEENNGTSIRVFCRMSNLYFLPLVEGVKQTETGILPETSSIAIAPNSPVEGTYGGSTKRLDEWEREYRVPQWVAVKNNVELKDMVLRGRYLQWKAVLYGTEGRYTPVLNSLIVSIEPNPPPGAPVLLEVSPANRGAVLRWVKNKEKDIVGYKVYYGISTKNYFGRGATQGDSPVFVAASMAKDDAEIFELGGLENEKVYFISLTAVDNAQQESGFSRELIVRPSAIHE
ncbi:MAG: hypothetical protein ACUVWJ_10225 [Spirochaetota bacterium]